MKTNNENNLKEFKIYVAECNSNFFTQLDSIVQLYNKKHPNMIFKLTRETNVDSFNKKIVKNENLIFIEDKFLIGIKPSGDKQEDDKKTDIILLLNGYFKGENVFKIKEAIIENSLNLTGNLSLTNIPAHLIRMFVVDYIRNKAESYE